MFRAPPPSPCRIWGRPRLRRTGWGGDELLLMAYEQKDGVSKSRRALVPQGGHKGGRVLGYRRG